MKKMKKILAMLLALTMVLGMGLTTMAAEEATGTSQDRGTITVKGIDSEDGIKVIAYQIVKANYDNDGSFSKYEVVYKDVESVIDLTPDATTRKISITQENLNAVITKIAKNEVVADTRYPMDKVDDSTDYAARVPVGSYLVLISDAEAKVYSPIVVSVNYVSPENGSNMVEGGTVDLDIEDGLAWVKESSVPTFTKTEEDALGNANNDFALGNSVDVGSNVNYTFTIGSVPYYGGDHPVFNVLDRIQPGLEYNGEFVAYVDCDKNGVIEIGKNSLDKKLTAGKDYTVTVAEDKQSFVLDFVVGDEYKLNRYEGMTVIFKYQAKLVTADNHFNDAGYRNDATLTFTYDSKVAGENVQNKITKATYTYTFDLTNYLLKTGEDEHKNALPGAEFTLYTDAECTKPYSNGLDNDGVYVTNNNGRLEIKGLEADTYYLKETSAPSGYSVNSHVYKIEVKATYGDDGQLTTWGIYVDDAEEAGALTIPNTKLVNLPSTGGIGTTIFTVAGCGIMIAAAFFFFASRKKEN